MKYGMRGKCGGGNPAICESLEKATLPGFPSVTAVRDSSDPRTSFMRLTNLLVLAAVAGTATATANAQTESRVRVATPAAAGWRIDGDGAHHAALGVGTTATGTLRDTLGLMISSITRGSPAE